MVNGSTWTWCTGHLAVGRVAVAEVVSHEKNRPGRGTARRGAGSASTRAGRSRTGGASRTSPGAGAAPGPRSPPCLRTMVRGMLDVASGYPHRAEGHAVRNRLARMWCVTHGGLRLPQPELQLLADLDVRRVAVDVAQLVGVGHQVVQLPLRRVGEGARAGDAQAVVVEVDELVALGPVAVVGRRVVEAVVVLPVAVVHPVRPAASGSAPGQVAARSCGPACADGGRRRRRRGGSARSRRW